MSIDIGLNNLATCWDGNRSFIIDGRKVKSINCAYNKTIAKLQSIKDKQGYKFFTHKQYLITRKRNNRIKDYMHKAAKKIMDYALVNNVGVIIVGHNKGWKQTFNKNNVVNQNFIQVPFGLLIQNLKYKCQEYGLEYKEVVESHTSKCSFLDLEEIKHHNNYLGKRIKRGLFKSSKGIKINADVNGAANIGRKVAAIQSLTVEQVKGMMAYPLRLKVA